MKIVFRGAWLRTWQRLPKIKYRILKGYFPIEFSSSNKNKEVPCHMGIDSLPIGPSGFVLHICDNGKYHATQKYYDKYGNVAVKEFKSGFQ